MLLVVKGFTVKFQNEVSKGADFVLFKPFVNLSISFVKYENQS